jgi:hypothetical protein
MAEGPVDALNRVFRITHKMVIRQQHMQFSYHLRDALIPNMTSEDAFNDAEAFMNASLLPAFSAQVTFERLEAERLITKEFFAKDYVNKTGAVQGAFRSTMLCTCVSLKSASRSRHRNGRMFWPAHGDLNNDVLDGPVLQGFTTAAAAMAAKWVGQVIVGNFNVVVVGRLAPAQVGLPFGPPFWTDVTTIRVNPIVSALRSRKVGVGN